ncbi:hypothetical protein EN918_39890, partial [Mesorhizobium sp. M7A.F.Ca.CA.004.05.1.1]
MPIPASPRSRNALASRQLHHRHGTRPPEQDYLSTGSQWYEGQWPMNVANLQLEGLLMAVAAVNNALVRRGLL